MSSAPRRGSPAALDAPRHVGDQRCDDDRGDPEADEDGGDDDGGHPVIKRIPDVVHPPVEQGTVHVA